MRALTYERYGPPEVVRITDVPKPEAGPGEVLVHVHASGVNTGDWRIRSAAFPGVLAIPGRLMFGVLKPRNRRLGTEFAGTVEALGEGTTRFAVGDRVYGFVSKGGATAEYLAISQHAAIAAIPSSLSFEDAAAVPFGGLAALVFLTQFGALQVGQSVLIVGASGGVGAYAVQIAKAYGAVVTGVAGRENQELIHDLGADQAVDYTATDVSKLGARFDLILDTVGALSPSEAFKLLKTGGTFLPLNMGLREIGAVLLNRFRDETIKLGVNEDKAEDLATLNALIEDRKLRPLIDHVYPLDRASEAHARVEGRHKKGAVILRVASG